MVDTSKHVRVDNWGVFFLQRLQTFFNKTDYCDLTLQFDGNVQLKVHRLVMNACTEYFQVLEQTCDVVDDNIILMPPDLQADVILPIVNFMYTGTLEYHPSIYDRLVHTADLMNVPILIKLLEAHNAPSIPVRQPKQQRPRKPNASVPAKRPTTAPAPPSPSTSPSTSSHYQPPSSSSSTATNTLPSILPGRKLPVWKRKQAPMSQPHTIVPRASAVTVPAVMDGHGHGGRPVAPNDPLSLVDNTPRPTRFEWPDGDDEDNQMRTIDYMEASAFDNITSYSSRPLMRGEDADRLPIYEDTRYTLPSPPTTTITPTPTARRSRPTPTTVKPSAQQQQQQQQQQHTRPALHLTYTREQPEEEMADDEDADADDPDYHPDSAAPVPQTATTGQHSKRRPAHSSGGWAANGPAKRVRFNEKENKDVKGNAAKGIAAGTSAQGGAGDIDHSKLIAELLKKYPNLAKTNKNIKLRIMTKPASNSASAKQAAKQQRATSPTKVTQVRKVQVQKQPQTTVRKATTVTKGKQNGGSDSDGPWVCAKCVNPPEPYHLYYLYRKHMTDVHQDQFSPLMCKYCGRRNANERALSFHMHTVHGAPLPPTSSHPPFPQCDRCPFAALTQRRLDRHKGTHRNAGHVQCSQCRVGFVNGCALGTHQQITGHTCIDTHADTTGLTSFDCQYCTRHWQNSATLFAHLRAAHREEARRDGIVSVDEDPEEREEGREAGAGGAEEEHQEEQEEEEGEEEEDLVVQKVVQRRTVTAAGLSDKVKILTDLKVAGNTTVSEGNTVQMQVTNAGNVATGITTTLGLVDIVVLDDNQQYILQSTNGDLDQPEFILPQLSGSYVHQGQQLITTSASGVHQVITTTSANTQQSQQTTSTTAHSTDHDELVMVLTDHDYNEEDGEVVLDESGQQHRVGGTGVGGGAGQEVAAGNIVVLYSHPVGDGQNVTAAQYITAGEGGGVGDVGGGGGGGGRESLLVQTAEGQVLEIRNGSDLVDATADHSSQQESIELIAQEIRNSQRQRIIDVEQPQEAEEEEEHHIAEDTQTHEIIADEMQEDLHQQQLQQEQHQVEGVTAEEDQGHVEEEEEEAAETEDNVMQEQHVILAVSEELEDETELRDEDEIIEEQQPPKVDGEDVCEAPTESEDQTADVTDGVVVERHEAEELSQVIEYNEQTGTDVCGPQNCDGTEEAMEVDETVENEGNESNHAVELAQDTETFEDVSNANENIITSKTPELPSTQEETNSTSNQQDNEEEVQTTSHEEQTSTLTNEITEETFETTQTEQYIPEAMEVDAGPADVAKDDKSPLEEDSIAQTEVSCADDSLNEDKTANTTYEEDDNDDIGGVPHVTGEDDVNQEVDDREIVELESKELTLEQRTDCNEGEVVHTNDAPTPTKEVTTDEDASQNSSATKEAAESSPANVASADPPSATIALLDDWNDTEDSQQSSHENKNGNDGKSANAANIINDWDDDD